MRCVGATACIGCVGATLAGVDGTPRIPIVAALCDAGATACIPCVALLAVGVALNMPVTRLATLLKMASLISTG